MPLSDDQVRDVLTKFAELGPEPASEIPRLGLPDIRRGRRRPQRRPPSQLRLVARENDLVVWEWGFERFRPRLTSNRARRASGPAGATGKEIFSHTLQPMGVNQIGEMLLDFDCSHNPDFDRKAGWKLRQWHDGPQLLGDVTPPGDTNPSEAKSILVVVHGTASCADHIVSEMQKAEGGGKFLADAAKKYSAVLAFEHPTLSMSPVLNALDLAAALAPYGKCPVDIVCHSRGGLVASWWMHVVDGLVRDKRCVFVGSPLQGTNLANPEKLRSSLHLLASYGRALGDTVSAAGILALPMTVLKVAASVVDFTAKLPLLDAALAMIPGLGAQSAITNNQEIFRLNARKLPGDAAPKHFYIRANFESANEGWKFWRYFTNKPLLRLVDAAVDTFVFPAANDLVVDTDFMLDSMQGAEFQFPTDGGIVHHTNYFEQKQTIEKIREWFQI
jgi:pimeloyl-ACP methyl ester carboxylesterase